MFSAENKGHTCQSGQGCSKLHMSDTSSSPGHVNLKFHIGLASPPAPKPCIDCISHPVLQKDKLDYRNSLS